MAISVPYAMVELRLCCGCTTACDALSHFVTFSCILSKMISYARRGLYRAFMSFLQGVFRFVLVWCVKSFLKSVDGLESLW